MNRDEFYHLLRASADIIETQRQWRGIDVTADPARILVLGSQSILGSWSEEYLPDQTTESVEMDVAFMPTVQDEFHFEEPAQEFADWIEASLGEGSRFYDAFDVYAQGVTRETAILPEGWEDRLVRLDVPQADTSTQVFCLDPYDLCAGKLTRLEYKDRAYVSSLIDAGDISVEVLRDRIGLIRDPRFTMPLRTQANDYLNAFLSEKKVEKRHDEIPAMKDDDVHDPSARRKRRRHSR